MERLLSPIAMLWFDATSVDEDTDEEAPNEEVNDGKIACCHGKIYKMRGLNIHKYVRKKTNKYKMCS